MAEPIRIFLWASGVLLYSCVAAYAEPPVRIQALLVGVAAYPPASVGLKPLQGPVNDATAVASVMRSHFDLDDAHIAELYDADATRDAILATIRAHLLERTGPGDTAVFYFAGHGSQITDNDGDEADLLDETLVPYDGRLPGAEARDIRDDELRALFSEMTRAGVHVVVILDSCHSGSATRARATHRRAALNGRSGTTHTGLETQDVLAMPKEGSVPVLLAAAQSHQLAFEFERDGVVHGAFTRALVEALRLNRPGVTYRDLVAEVTARLRGSGSGQRPLAEGLLSTVLFDGARSSRRAVFAGERVGPDRFVMQAGTIMGAAEGSEFSAYENAAAAAGLIPGAGWRTELIEVSAYSSIALVDPSAALPDLAYFVETKRAYRGASFAVDLSALADTDLAERARRAIAITDSVTEAKGRATARLRLLVDANGLDVLAHDGSIVSSGIDPGGAGVELLASIFLRVLRHDAFMQTANESQSIDVEIFPLLVDDGIGTYRPANVGGIPTVGLEQKLRFCVRNSSRLPRVYVHLFLVKDTFWIEQLHPLAGARADPMGQYVQMMLPEQGRLRATEIGVPIFRALITDQPIQSDLLVQREDAARDRAPLPCLGTGLSALEMLLCNLRDGARAGSVAVDEWETANIPISVVAESPIHDAAVAGCEF